ncbi:MAG TPA: hypothetical protein VEU78_10930 [Steroidobacteraceae bacterium]|nr:hypothetical protein [Steroidobacteraceae bacterium]
MRTLIFWAACAAAGAAPGLAAACACGCGVFDVATSEMFPTGSGGMVFLEQDFMDQNQNWSGTASAPAGANPDQRIRTSFWTVGAQYMVSRSFGVQVEVPYWDRLFDTTTDTGAPASVTHGAQGDVRLKAIYTGLSPDLSTGITFGVKLPTGDSSYTNFDPDTEIGTGSTDAMLGAYHLGSLTADNEWSWFASAQWQQPVAHKAIYRPGAELDAVSGLYYAGWNFAAHVRLTPLLQLEGTYRRHDGGLLGHPGDSGYTRAFVAPGLELDTGSTRWYAEVAQAVYTNASGNQLIARTLFKLSVSARF